MGFRIKEYAYEQGMRLGDVARKLRMPFSNLSAIAAGRRNVSIRLLGRIAGLLNCSISELFEEEGRKPVFRSERLDQALLEIEEANPFGIEKGWIHRLTLTQQKHFKGVREGRVPYGVRGTEHADPCAALIHCLNKAGVDYVVIGISGINYYATSATDSFGTQDYDLFLRPAISNAAKALTVFHELGYETFVADHGAVKEKDLKPILRKKRTVLAVNPDGVTFELLFAVSGFTFRQFASDVSIFKAGEVLIRVGKLHKLLASKQSAGRSKDKLFLKRYEMNLRERGKSKPKN